MAFNRLVISWKLNRSGQGSKDFIILKISIKDLKRLVSRVEPQMIRIYSSSACSLGFTVKSMLKTQKIVIVHKGI